MNRLSPTTRLLLAIAVLALASGYFLPLWEIQLWAPQYPEGLNMKIWLDRITGDYEIINGINHYIGMKPIREEMFPEFQYMGIVLGFLIAAGLAPVLTGRRSLLVAFVAILLLGGALGIYDFWRWGHDYGRNLDPKAAISVPGMTYDPPLVGYKNLLNFTAYSGPERGGWVLIGSGAVAVALLLREFWSARRARRKTAAAGGGGASAVTLLSALLLLPGCESGPQAIDYGKDECAECRMTLVDRHYGTEFVSGKGKVFKFDDVNCMIEFVAREPARSDAAGRLFIVDFQRPNVFLRVEDAVFLKHPKLRSPMGSHLGAFATEDELRTVRETLGEGGETLRWEQVRTLTF
jgi:copper chaperone NosL